MNTGLKRRMLMGIGRFMIPVPRVIAAKALDKGAAGAKVKADLLSPEERKIHHFVVSRIAETKTPLTAEQVGKELDLLADRVDRHTLPTSFHISSYTGGARCFHDFFIHYS